MFNVALLAILLGLRHGIDYDHLAAISDLTGSSQTRTEGFRLGSFYALGHAVMIIALAAAIYLLGLHLPASIDLFMEKVVGLTLVALGGWLGYSLFFSKQGDSLPTRGRLVYQFFTWLHHRAHPHHSHVGDLVDKNTAFSIGIIHGIGAETPTQALLLATILRPDQAFFTPLVVIGFVGGLVLANTAVTAIAVFGYSKLKQYRLFYKIIGAVTTVFSLMTGFLMLRGGA